MQAATTTEQQTIIPEIHPDEVIDFMNIDETDYSAFTMAQRTSPFRGGRLRCAARCVRHGTHHETQSRARGHSHETKTV